MDKKAFYAALRKRDNGVFGTSLSQSQVEGMEAILDECIRQSADLGQAAYILGTAYGESGRRMQPAYENMRYSAKRIPQVFSAKRRQGLTPQQLAGKPELLANTVYGGNWGRVNLGNAQPGDGWRYRGTGIGQITGRRNFTKWGNELNLPLTTRPELMMRLDVSVRALVEPMLEGWATGLRLDRFVKGSKRDYRSARQVWNGTFAADTYAGYARAFEVALEAAGYPGKASPKPVTLPKMEEPPKRGFWAILAALFKSFGKDKPKGGER